jgi:hypothetical protein
LRDRHYFCGRISFAKKSVRIAFALAAAVVVGAATAGVIVVVHSSGHPADAATLAAVDIAAVALAIAVLTPVDSWRAKGRGGTASASPQAAAAADRLAGWLWR